MLSFCRLLRSAVVGRAASDALMRAALNLAPVHGFTKECVVEAAKGCDSMSTDSEPLRWTTLLEDPNVLNTHFPRGLDAALIEHAAAASNATVKNMLDNLLTESQTGNAVPVAKDIVYSALQLKLQCMRPYIHHWGAAIRTAMIPRNAPYSIQLIAELADDVCFYVDRCDTVRASREAVGKTEAPSGGMDWAALEKLAQVGATQQTAIRWYFLRGKVTALYGTTVLHMIGDPSAEHAETFQFLKTAVDLTV